MAGLFDDLPDVGGGLFDDLPSLQKKPDPPTDRSWTDALGDGVSSFGASVNNTLKSVTDLAGTNNPVSNFLGDNAKTWQGNYSPQYQGELKRQSEEKAALGDGASYVDRAALAAKQTIRNPIEGIGELAGNIAPMAVTGLAGLGARGMIGLSAMMGAGAVKGGIAETIQNAPEEALMSDPLYARMRSGGVSEQDAKEQLSEQRASYGEAYGKILLGGGIGALVGKFGSVENALANIGKAGARDGLIKGIGKEVATEIPQEMTENYLGNKGAASQGADIAPDQNVIEAGVKAGILSAVGGGVSGVAGGKPMSQRERAEADIAAAMNDTSFTQFGVNQDVGNALRTEAANSALIRPEATVVSFADPNGPAAKAGITPIVVPTPQNVSTPSNTGGLAAGAGNGGSPVVGPSVGGVGQFDVVGRGMGAVAGTIEPGGAGNPSVPLVTGQPSTSVNPVKRTADADLLSKVAYEEEGAAPATNATPDSIWTGRSGAGYDTVESAQQAMESRVKKDPELQWKVEQRPDGKYHLAGYSTGDTNGQAATPVVAGQPAARDSGDAVRNEAGLAPQGDPANVRGRENLGDATAAADLSSRIGKPLTLVTPEAVRGLPANSPRARAYRVFSRFAGVANDVFGYKPVAISGLGNYGVQYDGRAYVDIDEMSDGRGEGVAGMVLHTMGHEVGHTMQKSSDPEDKAAYQGLRSVVVQYAKDGVIARRQRFEDKAAVADGMKAPGRDYAIDEVVNDVNGGMWRDSKFWGMLYDLDSGSTMRRIAYKFMQAATKVIGAAKKNGYNDIDTLVGENIEIVREAAAKAWADRAMRKGKDFKARPALKADLFDTAPSMSRNGRSNFEVAPDPNDKELSGKWNAQTEGGKLAVSEKIAREIVPKVLAIRGASGKIVPQVGSYLDDTNPSFALVLSSGDLHQVSMDLGYVLSQDSMMNISTKPFAGGEKTGAVVIKLGPISAKAVKDTYDKLRAALPNEVGGQSFAEGQMTVLNYSDTSTIALAEKIDEVLGKKYYVEHDEVYSSFPEKKDYTHASTTSNSGNESLSGEAVRGRLDTLRAEATKLIETELGFSASFSRKGRPGVVGDKGVGAEVDGAIHYGKAAGLSALSGSSNGTGIKGAEQDRLKSASDPRIKKRVYFYLPTKGGIPNPEAGLGQHVYSADLTKLYDPLTSKPIRGGDANAFESAVLDAGFSGYVNQAQGIAVVLNRDVPVEYLGTSDKFNKTTRAPVDTKPKVMTRTEGSELVRKPNGAEVMQIINVRPKLKFASPSFKMEYGDARVLASEAGAADAVLAEAGSTFQFGEPAYSRRFKSVDEFDSEPQDFDRMNELGNFSVDTNDAADDFAFPDLSGADKKLDKQAELQAELDQQFRQRMVDRSKLKAGPATVTLEKMQEAGMNPESAFSLGEMTERDGAIEFSGAAGYPEAGDMYEVSEYPAGWRVGTEHSFTMGNNWTKEGAIRQFRNLVTAPFIHKAGFDIAAHYRKGTALKLAQTWRNLAGKHGTFKLPARSKSMDFAEVAKEIGAISGYDILVEGNNRKNIAFTDKSSGAEFDAAISMLNDGSFKCCTMGLDGSKIGTEFYAVASEWARNNGYSFASDATLSAVNGFRRTEQATSYALKTEDTGVILPGVQNRVYGYNENPKSREDHDMNLARLLIAGMRNAMEVDPEIRRLRYVPETGKFTDSNGNDAEATVKAFLSNKDARASGMGRSTLARAVLTSQIIAGGFDAGAVTEFAEPVAYSRKMGVDSALSEAYGSDPSTDGANTEFSPQFAKWFGDSKVVNENGLPLVVYHGTKAPPARFEKSRTGMASTFLGDYEVERYGIFAAEDPELADEYANQGEKPTNQTVMPLFMSIKSPLDAVDGYYTDEIWANISSAAKRMGGENPYATARFIGDLWGRGALWKLFDADESNDPAWNIAMLKEAGYDGMRIYERSEGDVGNTAAWVAFDPAQVKSVFNNGDFDGTNPDISYARKQGPSERKYQDNYLVPEVAGEFADDSGNIAVMPGLVFAKDGINRTYPAMPIRVQVGEHMRDPSKVVHQYGLQHRIENKQKDVRRGYMTPEVDGAGTAPEVERAIRDIALGLYEATTVYADNAPRKVYLHAPTIDRMTVLERDRDSTGKEFWNVITSMPQTRADMMRRYKAPTTVGGITYNGERTQQAFDIKRGILNKLKEPGQSPVTSESYILDDDGLLFNQPVAETTKAETPVRVLARDANGKIILNKRKADPVSMSRKQATGLPDETKTQAVQRVMQDQYNRVKLVQDLLVESGGLVGEEQDVYRAEERMHGRVHELMRQFKDDVVQPFLDKAVAEKVDLNELALYAYAKHAKERNAHIQTFNRNVQTGSGMSDDTADNIIQMVDLAGDSQKFDDLHNDMMAMTATTRRVMLDEGLITQDQYDGLENMYQHYVPLRGFEDVEAETGKVRPGLGRGFNVKGKETIAAMGRDSAAGDIIENIIRDYERVTIRAEKNAVGKTFLDLVQNNPDPNLWEVQPIKRAARKDSNGLVQYVNVEDKGEDTVAVKVAGQQVYIKVHDPLFLRAMQNTFKGEKSDSERFVMRAAGLYTSLLRNTITRFNPVFGVINAVRDSQMGAMGVFDELGAEGLKLYAKHYAGALAAGARTEVNKSDPQKHQMDRWMREMRFAGGTTGGVFMRDNETIRSELRDAMLAAGIAPNGVMDWAKHNTGTRAVKHVLHALEVIGAVSEHAARLSAYTTAREMGRTPAQAASIAKNLTVNFNRFGEQGQLINTLFLFYNAAVQGSVRIGQMAKNPKVQKAFAGMAGVGLSLALIGAAVGGDDDDGQPYWDKIPDWEKERNIIIMLPPGAESGEKVGKHGRYIKIPMAYGLNVFPVLGYQMADVMRNVKDPTKGSSAGKAAINMVSAVMGSYNPFGGSLSAKPDASWALAVAPTVADPIIQLSQGVDGFGKPTGPAKSQFDKRPDSEIVSGTRHGKVEHRIARYLNEATGGNQAREGGIDLQPGTIKNIAGIVGGGLGKFVGDMVNLGYLGVQDLPIETRDIPVYKAFYGEYDKKAGMSQYYERSQKAVTEFDSMKNEMKLGVKRGEYSDEEKFLQRMGGQAEEMSKALGELKKWEVSIAESDSTDREKEIKRKEVQKVRERLAADYNKRWYREESKLKARVK